MLTDRRLAAVALATVALHALIALGSNADPAFCGSMGRGTVTDELRLYERYASRALRGEVPYRDYAVEYPPLALPLFVVPRLLAPGPLGYRVAFGAEMLLFDAWAVVLVARRANGRGGPGLAADRLGWYTLFFVNLCPLLTGRFDLAPMAVGFAAACSWSSGRGRLGGTLAGVGILTKVFPGAIVPAALAWDAARPLGGRGRGLASLALTLAIGAAAWYALGGARCGATLRYHLDRGLEIESLYAGIVLLAGKLAGTEVGSVYDFGAFHLAPTGWTRRLGASAPAVQAAAILLAAWRGRESGAAVRLRYAAAAVLAFAVAGKVLSPQYMIWLFPFMAAIDGPTGRRARPLFLVACALTWLIYPIGYFDGLRRGDAASIAILNLRNGALVALLGLLLFGPAGAEDGRAANPPDDRHGTTT